MHWENSTANWPDVDDSDVPAELLDGLERLTSDSDLLKIRLRWRPHLTAATGFLTKDRLLDIRHQPVADVARVVASFACHLHDQGGCESKFEAQVHRELEGAGEGNREREWRSITFYVHQPPATSAYEPLAGDSDDGDDFETGRYSPSWSQPSRSTAPVVPSYAEYASFVELSRTDPTAFAMIVMQQSNDRTVAILERLLMSSVSRLDGVLGTQVSNSRYLNEALQTLTKGASEVAGLGVNLFNQGLEGQARVARMEHETELGKERTELMRDAVKQGSLLLQAVVMSQSAKQRMAPTPAPEPSRAPPSTPPAPAPQPEPPPQSAPGDVEIEAKAERLLELATDDVLAGLREVAPSLAGVFDELRAEPVTALRVRKVIHHAQAIVDPIELGRASDQFEPEIASAFGTLVMRVLSEDAP